MCGAQGPRLGRLQRMSLTWPLTSETSPRGMRHSGSLAWPASSTNTCVKCPTLKKARSRGHSCPCVLPSKASPRCLGRLPPPPGTSRLSANTPPPPRLCPGSPKSPPQPYLVEESRAAARGDDHPEARGLPDVFPISAIRPDGLCGALWGQAVCQVTEHFFTLDSHKADWNSE